MGGRIVASELKHQVQSEAITTGSKVNDRSPGWQRQRSRSVGFDVAAYSRFHFRSPWVPSPLEGDFVGMFMVLLGLGGIDLSKILI
jgi:hypothetical protein